MFNFKYIFGILGVTTAFIGYIPYLRDTINGKTKPHIYSWFLWALVSTIIFALQFAAGGGVGTFVTLATGILCLIVFILGLRNGQKDITFFDGIILGVCLISIGIWLFAKDPYFSNYLLVGINVLIILPTLRKSWKDPYSETLCMWTLGALCNVFALAALANYSMLTFLYPAYCAAVNAIFGIMLIARRAKVSSSVFEPAPQNE